MLIPPLTPPTQVTYVAGTDTKGDGLFAMTWLKAGDTVAHAKAPYDVREELGEDAVAALEKGQSPVEGLSPDFFINVDRVWTGDRAAPKCRWYKMNHSSKKPNCKLKSDSEYGFRIEVVGLDPVPPGVELVFDYGFAGTGDHILRG